MADAQEVLIGEAVKDELNSSSRSWQSPSQFTATREWAQVYMKDDLKTLQVKVVPLTIPTEVKLSREPKEKMEYEIAIDFQQMVQVSGTPPVPNKATLDALAKLAQDVHDFYRDAHALATLSTARVMMATRPTLFDEALLYQHDTWETTVFLTVRVHR